MFLFAHNIMLGYPKPGARKDANFLKTTFERFKELLQIADENSASIVLTGKAISTMRLEHWLNFIDKVSDFDVKIYLIVTSRPSDDLIALHNSGHITLVNTATKRVFNSRGEMAYVGNVVNFKLDNDVFFYDVTANEFAIGDDSFTGPNVIQYDHNLPAAVLVTKELSQRFSHQIMSFASESHDVLMNYVEAIQTLPAGVAESKFIQTLKDAEQNKPVANLQDAIAALKAPDDIQAYLSSLAKKAEAFDEYAQEVA